MVFDFDGSILEYRGAELPVVGRRCGRPILDKTLRWRIGNGHWVWRTPSIRGGLSRSACGRVWTHRSTTDDEPGETSFKRDDVRPGILP